MSGLQSYLKYIEINRSVNAIIVLNKTWNRAITNLQMLLIFVECRTYLSSYIKLKFQNASIKWKVCNTRNIYYESVYCYMFFFGWG